MAMTVMAEGAARIFDLADLIDARCGGKRIATVDIGGGLSANYKSDRFYCHIVYVGHTLGSNKLYATA